MLEVALLDGDDEDGIDHPDPKDLMFDPWLTLSPAAQHWTSGYVEAVIHELSPKGRQARSELREGIATIIPTLMANLMVLHRTRPKGSRLVVGLRHLRKTRYDRKGMRRLSDVLRVLEVTGLIHRKGGEFKKLRTTILAIGRLKHQLLDPAVSLADVVKAEGEELIRLAARPNKPRIAGRKQPKVPTDYDDTAETRRMRKELEEINAFLGKQEITLEGGEVPPFRLIRYFLLKRKGDPKTFNQHGRLYGGFWMTLKATERHRLRINGEPIADLDYASMFPRLAYAHLGLKAPDGDLYAIPGLEGHREGAKAAFSALLSYPKDMKVLPARVRKQLPSGWNAKRVRQAFADRYPELSGLFECDKGLDLMFTESRILLATMRELMRQGVPALPMHDGMMVPWTMSDFAIRTMEGAARDRINFALPVTIKSAT
ncbi:hypothetical protein [Mesorhizobium sp. Z1-4]|uniref:hypothetical protein n=1 Tax=Mesorhizobium sp. Z1-4 TaxID=2448478 RepID=UPI000FDBB675|nr:hypothetical protein [Mesorhizobium sp. Z1-4]